MGVGVDVCIHADVPMYADIVFLYGLHFNFASCVCCYAAEAQCGLNGNAHVNEGRQKHSIGLFFRARTIAYIS